MEKDVQIPKNEAIPALWLINDCFGFRYPATIQHVISNGMLSSTCAFSQIIPQQRISELLENILSLSRDEHPIVHLVLWLNANINHPNHDAYIHEEAEKSKLSLSSHGKDVTELYNWACRVPEGETITISYSLGDKRKDSVKLRNDNDWFVGKCKEMFFSLGSPKTTKDILASFEGTPGRNAGKEKLCVAYGVYRFMRDYAKACNEERTSSLLHFLWVYLMEMGLEDNNYDPAKTGNLNTNLGRYDERYKEEGGKGNFHFQRLQLLNYPIEYYMD